MQSAAVKLAESAAPPRCDDSANAALIYAALSEAHPLASPPTDSLGDDFAVLRSDAWKQYLAEHREVPAQMRAAAALSGFRFERDWSHASIHDPVPVLEHLGRAARVLHAQGHSAILSGDAALAFQNAASLRRLAEQWSQDPRSMMQLMAMNAEGQASALIEHALSVRNPTQTEVHNLLQYKFAGRESMAQSLPWAEAEHYSAIYEMYVGFTGNAQGEGDLIQQAAAELGCAFSRLLFADDDLKTVPRQFEYLRDVAASSDASFAALDTRGMSSPYARLHFVPGGNVACYIVPHQYLLVEASGRGDAARRCCDLALQICERDQIAEILKASADAVVPPPERPVDPFSGLPLKIAAADGGVIVYSVGPNRRDDGGVEGVSSLQGDATICLCEAFRRRKMHQGDSDEKSP
jgi:hypothetical protein